MRRALALASIAAIAAAMGGSASGKPVVRAAFSKNTFMEQRRSESAPGCLAAPVKRGRVHAGPFTGRVNGPNYVVNGRFRLHVLGRNKMGWFLPRKRAKDAPSLSVKGVRLAPPGRVFTDSLAEIFGAGFPKNQHVYASNFEPPTEGCWRLTFKTRRLTGSLVVLARDG